MTERPTSGQHTQQREAGASAVCLDGMPPRLLPWTENGKPCYLATDDPHSRVSQIADEMERMQLGMGQQVLHQVRELMADGRTLAPVEARIVTKSLAECLSDALRVARSRGLRLGQVDGVDLTKREAAEARPGLEATG